MRLRFFLLLLWLAFAGHSAAQAAELENGSFTTRLNGLNLWYKVSGKGPVCIVPSPGWGPACDLYIHSFQPLEKRFTMVYLDTRGCGQSQTPKTTKEYRWEDLIADLDALRQHLKAEKVWLLGHSEGGVMSLHYALQHPKRVQGLILVGSGPANDRLQDEDMKARIAERKDLPGLEDMVTAFMGGWKNQTDPKTDEEFAALLGKAFPLYFFNPKSGQEKFEHIAKKGRSPKEGYRVFSADALRGRKDSGRTSWNLTGRLKEITAPTVIVVGHADFIFSPAQGQRLHLGIRNSKLLLVEKAGHFPWVEQEKAFFDGLEQCLRALE